MQVGEIVKRRKKIVQSGKISAVSWCPWDPKILATGDAGGILRLWNVNDRPGSNALSPGKLDTASVITGIHFSPHCKEILTAHGPRIGVPVPIDPCNPKPSSENALVVHSFPSLRHVTTFRLSIERGIGDTVLDGTGTKIIFATPSDGKISVSDVWAKQKEVKRERQWSMLSLNSRSSSYSLIR
ncbi:hypothetical protein GALMADRAFT_119293 [Galerina marginata CBS 339.88]|uniref:Anaphase-promoting complex subunit 4 WD40 domain-containing protein n=1 Tax=Galerina marginata (strain CBS 339.88) TaxID=685588 RepID=A0A067TEE5_GALM3|nr:hypothetical protein GALMADRAFT_119293 [Galerina marginata CBS 339.88]